MVVMSDKEFEEMMKAFDHHICYPWEDDDCEMEEEYEFTCECDCDCEAGREDDSDESFCITPKGIAALTLVQTGLAFNIDDPRIDGFWMLFASRMEELGYVEYPDDDE